MGSPAMLIACMLGVFTGLSFHPERLLYPRNRVKVPVRCWRGACASPPLLVGIFLAEVISRAIDGLWRRGAKWIIDPGTTSAEAA